MFRKDYKLKLHLMMKHKGEPKVLMDQAKGRRKQITFFTVDIEWDYLKIVSAADNLFFIFYQFLINDHLSKFFFQFMQKISLPLKNFTVNFLLSGGTDKI